MSANQCHIGDCREILPTIGKVQMCVTSPPYWGLRDYGTAQWKDGDSNCDHLQPVHPSALNAGFNERSGNSPGARKQEQEAKVRQFLDVCDKCGARRIDKQLGLEKTPEEYVKNMVEVFRLVRDVLADHGTLWLNMGDCYASSPPGCANAGVSESSTLHGIRGISGTYRETLRQSVGRKRNTVIGELKPKDLVGMPWRLAFALQTDGWYLRSDIIWHKPNPMPESVTDRPTKAHEYLFLLSKQGKYYYDYEAIRESANYPDKVQVTCNRPMAGMAVGPMSRGQEGFNHQYADPDRIWSDGSGRNKRSVWTISTQPYADAHFATFPEALVEPCILAGSRSGDVVLDPFFGSGTVGEVCERLGRKWIGIELNPEYAEMAKCRTSQIGLGI